MTRRMVGIGVVAAMAALMVVGLAFGQPGGGGGMGGGGFGGMDPAEMQKMMDQRNMEQLGVTEEQWKSIGPKFNAVQALQRSINAGGGMGMGGRRGGMGMMGGQPTELDKAREALNTVLDDPAATPDKIQAAVKAYRDARDKAKKDLVTAQADLKKTIGNNPKMEARLVARGMLD